MLDAICELGSCGRNASPVTKFPTFTTALIIDMQQRYLDRFPETHEKRLVERQVKIIPKLVAKKIPFVVLEFVDRESIYNPTVDVIKGVLKDVRARVTYLQKERRDGFSNPALKTTLKRLNTRNLFLMGVYASQCVQATAQTGLENGFNIYTGKHLIADHEDPEELSEETKKWYNSRGFYFDNLEKLSPDLTFK